jgi:hypothetical protein
LVVRALLLLSFLLWALSVRQAGLAVNQGIGELGLISVLPLVFFVSFSLLTACFLATLSMDGRSQLMLFCQLIMLILLLYLTPVLIEGTARFTPAYVYYQAVDYISQSGNIDPIVQWIHSWPAFSIAFSTLTQIAALTRTPGEQVFLGLYPSLFNIALFFPVFSLVRVIVDQQKLRWIAIWVFYIANWVGQDYFSVQSFALFAFILLLFALFKIMDSQGGTAGWFLVSTLLFSYLATSHFLSSLASLAVIVTLVAFKHFRAPTLALLFAVLAASWIAYGATARLPWAIIQVISQALKFQAIVGASVTARVAGSLAHIVVTQTRIIFSASISMFALSGLFLVWKSGKTGKTERRIALIVVAVCSLAGLFAYGGELFMRIFVLSLVPMAYFICKGSSSRLFFSILAIFLLFMAPPLHIVAHYGNERMDYVPPSELAGVRFFYNNTSQGYVIGWYPDLEYHQSYSHFSLSDAEWKNNALSLPAVESERKDWSTFVCLSYAETQFYSFQIGQPQFVPEIAKSLSSSARYDKIYSNPSYAVYAELPR